MPFRIDVLDATLDRDRQAALVAVLVRDGGFAPEVADLVSTTMPGPVAEVETDAARDDMLVALAHAGFAAHAVPVAGPAGMSSRAPVAAAPATVNRAVAALAIGLAVVATLLVGVLIGQRGTPAEPVPAPVVAGVPPELIADSAPLGDPEPVREPARSALGAWTTAATALPSETDGTATLRAVRTGRHDGFDRVVFEFDGDVLPPARVEPVGTRFTVCESDATFDVQGMAALAVTVQTSSNRSATDTEALLPSVRDVVEVCGVGLGLDLVQAIGLSGPRPYRTQVLRDPLRLVVDVRHGA